PDLADQRDLARGRRAADVSDDVALAVVVVGAELSGFGGVEDHQVLMLRGRLVGGGRVLRMVRADDDPILEAGSEGEAAAGLPRLSSAVGPPVAQQEGKRRKTFRHGRRRRRHAEAKRRERDRHTNLSHDWTSSASTPYLMVRRPSNRGPP